MKAKKLHEEIEKRGAVYVEGAECTSPDSTINTILQEAEWEPVEDLSPYGDVVMGIFQDGSAIIAWDGTWGDPASYLYGDKKKVREYIRMGLGIAPFGGGQLVDEFLRELENDPLGILIED